MTTLASFEISEADADIPPDIPDVKPLRCQHDGCNNAVTKPARGRTPKFCDEHKTTTKTASGKRAAGWVNAQTVEDALVGYFKVAGMGISMINPVDGSIIADGGVAVAHELVELARVNKDLRAFLEKLALPGKYGPLGLAIGGGILLPLAINHNLLPQFTLPTANGGENQ